MPTHPRRLTGQRFLAGYADDEAQYAALMNNAATFAQEHGLRPGVALTAEQMAQLTSDIVWLVEQTVALEDGSTAKVLVPQVYTRLREGDLKGDGTLIAGDSLQLDVAGDLFNSGTLAGRELVDMTAGNLTNLEGRIRGNRVDLKTRRDLTNLGGDITANESLSLQAGRDLNLASTSERLAGLYVTDPDGQLLAGAGRDLTIRGAGVDSGGSLSLSAGRDLDIASTLDAQSTRYGRATLSHADIDHQATLTAGQDLTLNAGRDLGLAAVDVTAGGNGLIATGRDLALETLTTGNALSGNRSLQRRRQQEVGTNLVFGDDLTLLAGQDLYARAANVSAEGDLGVVAGRDIEIEAGQSSRYEERRRGGKHTIDSQSRVQGSEFSAGDDLTLNAGDDLRLTASRIQAGQEAALLAGGDVEFLTAQEHDYSLYEKKSSGGLFGGSRTQRDEVSKTRAIGSEVTSGGDLLVASRQDQTYRAARHPGDDRRRRAQRHRRRQLPGPPRRQPRERRDPCRQRRAVQRRGRPRLRQPLGRWQPAKDRPACAGRGQCRRSHGRRLPYRRADGGSERGAGGPPG
ncbi:hemagglutinin repeat-containing protein [Halomonas sp. M4R5S39]|nr:hemagglutinin repeat-containing protein [Halomonas kalidii]MDI5984185.1 hemagglutinin repeat-containing protein [Halomonas kalidii]